MLRFRPPATSTASKGQVWPAFALEEPSTVFSPRPSLRKLMVVVDCELLSQTCSRADDLLNGLLSHPYVEVFQFSDQGPPSNADWHSTGSGMKYVPGWIVVGKPASGDGHIPIVQATNDESEITRRALIGNAPEIAEADRTATAYSERGEPAAAEQRVLDVTALEAAQEIEADLFITERPYLHKLEWRFARQVVLATRHQALPLVSLYLRRQEVFLADRSPDGSFTEPFSRGLFYWVGTRDLLPAGWRWFSACVQADQEQDSLIYLGQSLFQRVQRALQDRDAALWALNKPQDNDTADEALGSLDNVLLGLMAAVDVAARLAHRVLGFETDEYKAGWQRKRWLKSVKEAAPDLAKVVAQGSSGKDTLEILRLLRNSIHGAALQPLAVSTGSGERDATLVGLPASDAQRLVTAMDSLGGRNTFGLRMTLPNRVHADPATLLDAIFVRAVSLLDQLMRETPVERLSGALETAGTKPPRNDRIFGGRQRQSIRLQLGLEMDHLQD